MKRRTLLTGIGMIRPTVGYKLHKRLVWTIGRLIHTWEIVCVLPALTGRWRLPGPNPGAPSRRAGSRTVVGRVACVSRGWRR